MKALTAFLGKLLRPPAWVLCILSPAVFAALVYLFAAGKNSGLPAYLVYGLSAYCLTAILCALPRRIRSVRAAARSVRQWVGRSAVGHAYLHDRVFRGRVTILRKAAADLLYVVFHAAVGLYFTSLWHISLAVYYLALGGLRAFLLPDPQRDHAQEWRRYRRTARLLFLLNIPMGGMIILMVVTDSGFSYPGYVIYLSAMYTFYSAIRSVVHLVKCRHSGGPLLSAAAAVDLVAACMSLLGLQTAMISRFSPADGSFRQTMNAATGTTVVGAVIVTAVCMLLRWRKVKNEEGGIGQ